MNERQLAAAVDAWAAEHRAELVQDTIDLIGIPSITGEHACSQALEQLKAMATDFDFAVEQDGNLSISILHPGTDNRTELGMLGHLDVVPAGSGWRYAPFDAVEKNGWLIGRGACDNKGPVVMCLYVLRCLKEMKIPFRSTVRLIAGCREETDMLDVKHYLQRHNPPAFTINCDGAWAGCIGEKGILETDLVLDVSQSALLDFQGGTAANAIPDQAFAVLSEANPTALEIARAYDSVPEISIEDKRIILQLKGKSAHCCTPARGKNAVVCLLQLLYDSKLVQDLGPLKQCFSDCYGTGLRINHEDSVSGKTTCTATRAWMEQGFLYIHINARTAVTQRSEQLITALKKRLDKLGIALQNINWTPPRLDSPNQPEIRLLLDTCREFLDSKAKPYVMGGATHSRIFPRSFPFGPEVLDPRRKRPFGRAHEADEAVCIDDLLHAIKVYVLALYRLDSYFSGKHT
ncbi:MAG: Sapep family Mn(2+)-dependent dipeptidase [Clostridia bacterium]|nr:Sapep family Mn(2+)-dependent dipeptidase [Clostridia bacterium]